MAADWIKMRWNLRTDYRVRKIASRCGVTVPHAVGALHALWSIFDEHSNDGVLQFCSRESVESDTQTPGLISALEQVGWARWLDSSNDSESLELVGWLEHNGKSAKERLQNASRQNKFRNSVTQDRDIGVTQDRDKTVTREEKRREEKSIRKEAIASKRNQFEKPTVEQVKAYCLERSNSVDAEKFVDHYTSNGWRVGKVGMSDWKAAVRTWEKSTDSGGSSAVVKCRVATPADFLE